MPVASPWYDSNALLALIAIVTLLVVGIGVLISYQVGTTRYRIFYGASTCTSLLATPTSAVRKDIKITHLGIELNNPYILKISLKSRSRADMPSDTFDQGRPIVLDVGVPIVALLPSDEHKVASPKIGCQNTALEIGPDLIGKRQEFVISVLIDGEGAELAGRAYLTNGRLVPMPSLEQIRSTANRITAVIGIVAAGFLVAALLAHGALGNLLSIFFVLFVLLALMSGSVLRDFLETRYT